MKGNGALLGFIIGATTGAVQFFLLSRFTVAVSRGAISNKLVLLAVSQFLLPLGVLLCCALLMSQSLMWTGGGIAASLIVCAVARFFISSARNRTET